ncbi:hypothetical protein SISNIDRAFT_458352 [Sistotremastrum niveocremeum HHB9708]|uniref:P/Homo B domain-containing protein n=1 Tax=Sistotremastrum niveocremeum HHB9708 TaxID=1314777 RepID=A0A164QVZ7_9AGAM|nr:hypothetical protein SISNIDRAFT_458352 [Sistotremastrum niveocremeum HHB9708]
MLLAVSATLAFSLCLALASASAAQLHPWSYSTHDYFVLEHDPSHGMTPSTCASELGLELVHPLGELPDHWVTRRAKTESAATIPESPWGILQNHQSRRSHAFNARLLSSIKSLEQHSPRRLHKRDDIVLRGIPPPAPYSSVRAVADRFGIEDPLFSEQWHLVNEEDYQHTLNVLPVWERGITGAGVIVALIDDGLDFDSEDLSANFAVEGSYDFNDHVPLPRPRLADDTHGTRCAGQIAAGKNDACGVGVAYGSKVAGLRMLSGPVSSIEEATAVNYHYQETAIYSCSWGPRDDGRTLEAPAPLIKKAILNGITRGRGGKGSLFVFASGNGGNFDDQCNFDGYANSIYTITVSAIDATGGHPWYSEPCAANMVVTYSSGDRTKRSIATTDVGENKCTNEHGGTSAAAPFASAIFALALSARPELSWRDIQYLCIHSAVPVNLDDPDWEDTALGKPYSNKFGWGKLDADRFVSAAMDWQLVNPQVSVNLERIMLENATISEDEERMAGGALIGRNGTSSSVSVNTNTLVEQEFDNLEHVTITVWINHQRRGDVEVSLVSPHGIRSILASKRAYDTSEDGFFGWTFSTVKHW